MPQYFAFLRSINVGGRTVKMDRLRQIFTSLGFAKVETFIASGNVIFESRVRNTTALEKKIENVLQETLGYKIATFIRTRPELAGIANHDPFAKAQGDAALYIALVSQTPKGDARTKLMSFRTKNDDFHVNGREIYWLCRKSFSKSDFSGAILEKILGSPATLRNVTTVRGLAAKYAGREAGLGT